jgi:hypothetical protein
LRADSAMCSPVRSNTVCGITALLSEFDVDSLFFRWPFSTLPIRH